MDYIFVYIFIQRHKKEDRFMEKSLSYNQVKRDRFIKIVERRVNTILNNLDSLGKCSNKRNYEYSEADVKKMFREIDKKSKEIKALFNGRESTKRFSLE